MRHGSIPALTDLSSQGSWCLSLLFTSICAILLRIITSSLRTTMLVTGQNHYQMAYNMKWCISAFCFLVSSKNWLSVSHLKQISHTKNTVLTQFWFSRDNRSILYDPKDFTADNSRNPKKGATTAQTDKQMFSSNHHKEDFCILQTAVLAENIIESGAHHSSTRGYLA